MAEHKRIHKLNNKGSAIVTVLIVIIFISILATTILYLAGRNVKMKATDRDTKESFYGTEQAMEEVKAGLIRIASLSYEDAYRRVMREYGSYDAAGRKNLFNETYLSSFETRWNALAGRCADLVTATSGITVTSAGNSALDTSERASGILYVRNVVITGKKDGYTTIIGSDFAIVCPKASFEVGYDTSVPDTPEDSTSININDCVMYTNWEKR